MASLNFLKTGRGNDLVMTSATMWEVRVYEGDDLLLDKFASEMLGRQPHFMAFWNRGSLLRAIAPVLSPRRGNGC